MIQGYEVDRNGVVTRIFQSQDELEQAKKEAPPHDRDTD
jgi:hypothetical protein